MRKNCDRWLSFLLVHPDPILISSDKRGFFFVNDDCQSVLAPEFVGSGLVEEDAL